MVEKLRVITRHGSIPNLILTGSSGIGKTTSILCLARELLGDSFDGGVLELNASDENGIDMVNKRIKTFAMNSKKLPKGRHKLVILDEADGMTKKAQQALRQAMEIYSHSTRFVFACNISSKIIEPIQSRCVVLHFTRLSDDQIKKRLKVVMDEEKIIDYTPEGIDAIIFTAQGDMRQALNNLQSTFTGTGAITPENVFKTADQPHPYIIKNIIKHCDTVNISSALEELQKLWNKGYACIDIVDSFFRVTKSVDILEKKKLAFLKEIGLTHMRVQEGSSSLLQLSGLIARLCLLN